MRRFKEEEEALGVVGAVVGNAVAKVKVAMVDVDVDVDEMRMPDE